MIDIHIHVLPGIDDGAADLDEAVEMCRLAAADGCETLIATPHQRHDRWRNTDPEALERLRQAVEERTGGVPALRLGAEVRADSALLADLEAPGRAGVTPLAGSRYLLVELDRQGIGGPDPEFLVHELRIAGWQPILAHPEFIAPLAGSTERMDALRSIGALFQITAMSLTGDFGSRVRRLTRDWIDMGLVDFVASDAHGPRRRPPGLAAAYEEVALGWGEDAAEALLRDNPAAILEDADTAAVGDGATPAHHHREW